jgi:hypothetical protein
MTSNYIWIFDPLLVDLPRSSPLVSLFSLQNPAQEGAQDRLAQRLLEEEQLVGLNFEFSRCLTGQKTAEVLNWSSQSLSLPLSAPVAVNLFLQVQAILYRGEGEEKACEVLNRMQHAFLEEVGYFFFQHSV